MIYVLVSTPVSKSFASIETGDVLGQQIELSAAEVQSVITDGRACLLPKKEFDRIFADVDPSLIAKYSTARTQAGAPPAFRKKLNAAIDATTVHRQQLIIAADRKA
ncbi:MAG: hypothetical protein WDO73_02755 [Ignavibacteriota bacterium]